MPATLPRPSASEFKITELERMAGKLSMEQEYSTGGRSKRTDISEASVPSQVAPCVQHDRRYYPMRERDGHFTDSCFARPILEQGAMRRATPPPRADRSCSSRKRATGGIGLADSLPV